jgi:hypothetical protein
VPAGSVVRVGVDCVDDREGGYGIGAQYASDVEWRSPRLDGQYIARQEPDYLSLMEKYSWNGESRWRDGTKQRIYTYDRRHGHIEAYTRRGRHVAVLDVETGERIGPAVNGRSIDV